ncbi:MAG: hypothetical protein AUK47_17490 [Deltaproteobacteria bacterium CG2_30_63_29]|nr:MAG: hypothetical protein AUK47_17490 [Deltaproteobacteria bacterium CG2_30_63_29]
MKRYTSTLLALAKGEVRLGIKNAQTDDYRLDAVSLGLPATTHYCGSTMDCREPSFAIVSWNCST